MPRFYFHLRAESDIHRDLEGNECRDLSAANAHARDIAVELMRNSGRDTCLWSMRVEDAHGSPVFDLFFADVAAEIDGLPQEQHKLAAETCRRFAGLIDVLCDVQHTMIQSSILIARARGKPILVHGKRS